MFWVVLSVGGAIFATGLYFLFGPEPNKWDLLLAVAGFALMAATLVEQPKATDSRLPILLAIAVVGLVVNLIVLGLDIYDRQMNIHDYPAMQAKWLAQLSTLPTTSGEDLTDKIVHLDGRRFENCTINGGTHLVYEGEKPFVFNCQMAAKPNGRMLEVASDNPVIEMALALNHNFEVYTGGQVPVCQSPEGTPSGVPAFKLR